ncbi:MAG: peptidylprolyl isomerase [Patescibacteria group bacterium]
MQRKLAIIIVVLAILLLGSIPFWGKSKSKSAAQESEAVQGVNTMTVETEQEQFTQLAEKPSVRVETSLGSFTIRLYAKAAPELTKNFLELARSGYYNGLTFHRIVPGFVVQGGDPNGDGTGGHSYRGDGTGLADEPGALALKHYRGAVAWAKSSLPNSIGSQFYVALDDLEQLDGGYSVFGQVVDGLDVVDRIAAVKTDQSDRPVEPVMMKAVTVAE